MCIVADRARFVQSFPHIRDYDAFSPLTQHVHNMETIHGGRELQLYSNRFFDNPIWLIRGDSGVPVIV